MTRWQNYFSTLLVVYGKKLAQFHSKFAEKVQNVANNCKIAKDFWNFAKSGHTVSRAREIFSRECVKIKYGNSFEEFKTVPAAYFGRNNSVLTSIVCRWYRDRERDRERKDPNLQCVRNDISVTSKKLPNVYKSCQKMISLEKLKFLTTLEKLPRNVGDLGKLIVATYFEKLPKLQ